MTALISPVEEEDKPREQTTDGPTGRGHDRVQSPALDTNVTITITDQT